MSEPGDFEIVKKLEFDEPFEDPKDDLSADPSKQESNSSYFDEKASVLTPRKENSLSHIQESAEK